MSDEELQMRRERHDHEMAQIRASIAHMEAQASLASHNVRWPPVTVAAIVVSLLAPALLALARWIAGAPLVG